MVCEEWFGIHEQRADALLDESFKGLVDLGFSAGRPDDKLLPERVSSYMRLFGVALGIRVSLS